MDITSLPYRACAGVCLINADRKVWAGERIDTPGAWQMPQGGIDTGETPLAAAFRELEEETAIPKTAVIHRATAPDPIPYDLPADLIPRLWGGKYRGQMQHWTCFELTGPDSLINIATDEPEFSRWQWMSPDELLTHIVPFKRAVYDQVFQAFRPHLARP